MKKSSVNLNHQVRIGGGDLRSRLVRFSDSTGLRPTPDRVRQTLFNWLGQDLTGKTCLDLFAGSGVLGFEALSRNAAQAVLVEKSAAVHQAILSNQATLNLAQAQVIHQDALSFLQQNQQRFDVIFCDPPYHQNWVEKTLPLLPAHLTEGGVVYVEAEYAMHANAGWQILKQGKAGNVFYHLLECA